MLQKIVLILCCLFGVDIPDKFADVIFSKVLVQQTAEHFQICSSYENASYRILRVNFYQSFFLPPIENAFMFHDCAGYYETTFYFKINCRLARSYKEYLVKIGSQSIYDALVVSPYVLEADILYEIHNVLDDATRKTSLMARRRALNRLIDLLGPQSYLDGKVPPPIPIWRYRLGKELNFTD